MLHSLTHWGLIFFKSGFKHSQNKINMKEVYMGQACLFFKLTGILTTHMTDFATCAHTSAEPGEYGQLPLYIYSLNLLVFLPKLSLYNGLRH